MKTRITSVVSFILALLFVTGGAGASPQYSALGSAFTFQGSLVDGGVPANGTYDFQFAVFDDASAGYQKGPTVTEDDVSVTDGRFTVLLDFGGIFDGTAMYLEIGVRTGSSPGAYTTLSPRQALTPAPYSLFTLSAPWSGLTGVPAGFADGVDDTGAGGASYQGVVIVAKSGGDFTSIQAALDSITDADADTPYLVWVAPGVYTEQVTMKPFVDIQGSGELTTKITHAGNADDSAGTVNGASNAELRFISIENTGGNSYATAIRNNLASPRFTHVTVGASGGTAYNYAVYNLDSSPEMTDSTASASGGDLAVGVNSFYSHPALTNVVVTASEGTFVSWGIWNGPGSTLTLKDATVIASGPADNFGVYNNEAGSTLADSSVTASRGTSSYGIFNVAEDGSYTVRVNYSDVSGGTNAVYNDSHFTTAMAASRLSGGVFSGGGLVYCAGVWNESYAFIAPPACP